MVEVTTSKVDTQHSIRGWTDKPFNIPEHFKERSTPLESSASSIVRVRTGEVDFYTIRKAVTNHFKNKYDSNPLKEEQNRWIDLKHGAVTGSPAAVEWFKKEIEDFLIRSNWLNGPFPFPKAYGDIVEAVYQETFGIGPISTWWRHPQYGQSEAASIIGTRVFFELPGNDDDLQDIFYSSEDDVIRVATQLALRSPTGQLNRHHPKLEINMEDGSRVTISIPPLTVQPQIVFRHFTMDRPTLPAIAEKKTFPLVILPVLDAIAEGRLTGMFCGPVKSGKTTFMKAFIAKRRGSDNMLVFHKDFDEMRIHEMLPTHKIMQYIINEDNMKETFPLALRSDYDYIVVAELRSIEAELFLKSSERGKPGALSNFHTMEPDDIPGLMADLIIEDFPSKNYESQYRRAAKQIHFVCVNEENDDRSKRTTRITLFDWNNTEKTFTTHDIMTWDEEKRKWVFHNYIPERLLKIMRKYAPEQTKKAIDVLNQLVKQQNTKEAEQEGAAHMKGGNEPGTVG